MPLHQSKINVHTKASRKLLKAITWVVPTTPLSAKVSSPSSQEHPHLTTLSLPLDKLIQLPKPSPEEIESARSISVCSTHTSISDGLIATTPISSPNPTSRLCISSSPAPHFQHGPTEHKKCWNASWRALRGMLGQGNGLQSGSQDCFCLICFGYDVDADSRPGSAYGPEWAVCKI